VLPVYCYDVLSTITKSAEIQLALTLIKYKKNKYHKKTPHNSYLEAIKLVSDTIKSRDLKKKNKKLPQLAKLCPINGISHLLEIISRQNRGWRGIIA
jgi:non-homologous end joining protein Ku